MSIPLQPLPNPFMNAEAGPRAQRPSRFAVQPALAAFLVCLVVGLTFVAWRAKARADAARARADLEILARGSAVELQLSQVVSAAEVLGALAKQHGGPIPEFQKVAAELLAALPGLASLELQQGGVVSDIVPRAPNARVIGLNLLEQSNLSPGGPGDHPEACAYRDRARGPLQRRAGRGGPGADLPAGPRWPRRPLGLCGSLNAALRSAASGAGG